MRRLLAGVVLVVAALPTLGERLPNDPRGVARRDAASPGSLAGIMRPAPEAGDPRVWYFVVLQGKDPDFEALGAQVEASWKNRRLVRVPPQAVQGLARHPDVQYLQRIDEPGTQGSRGAVAELSVGAESGSGQPSGHAELGTLTWTSGTYGYDGAGNIVSIGPDHYGRVQNYNYDGLGRLTTGTAHTSSGVHLESYGYDVYGNLIEKSTDGSGGPPLSVNSATNQLQTATYDVAGNMASYGSNEYFWDAGGMLKETWYGAVGQKGYVYTPDDERLGVVTSEGNYWTWTVRDVGGKVIREYESAGGEFQYAPWLWIEDYAHGLGRLLVSEREGAEGGRRHYHADHLGSTRFVTTEDGVPGVTAGDGYRATEHVYFPFGLDATELRQEHGLGFRRETRLKYTGHERDYMAGEVVENTNYLDYMHARYYNPNLGRFLSVDPKSGSARPALPQTWNRYAYTINNPLKYIDTNGEDITLVVRAPGDGATNFGHVALRVHGRGYDRTYDFGRYRETWGPMQSKGEGILRVWGNYGAFKAEQEKKGDIRTIDWQTSSKFDKAVMNDFDDKIKAGEKIGTTSKYTAYKLEGEYKLLSNNCTTVCMNAVGEAADQTGASLDGFQEVKKEKDPEDVYEGVGKIQRKRDDQ